MVGLKISLTCLALFGCVHLARLEGNTGPRGSVSFSGDNETNLEPDVLVKDEVSTAPNLEAKV